MAEELLEEPQIGTVLLGLGSNLGDRVRLIGRAIELLAEQIRLEAISSIYETEPVGGRDQPWFLNLVCMGVTRLSPRGVLEFTRTIEDALGRERVEESAPRTIDIDILAYDDRVIDELDLQVPHPRMIERAFVLQPLAEIAPEWRHPVEGSTAESLLEGVEADTVRPGAAAPRRSMRHPAS